MNIEIVGQWTGDHLPCINVEMETEEGKVCFSLWWVPQDVIGAMHYPDSPKAQKLLERLISLVTGKGQDWFIEDHDEKFSEYGMIAETEKKMDE